MSAIFAEAIEVLIANEGGLTDDPGDPGGVTAYGLILSDLIEAGDDVDGDGDIDVYDVRALMRPENADLVRRIWRARYWDRYCIGAIDDQLVATKIFDQCAVIGGNQAGLAAQRACHAVGRPVAEDGFLGRNSFAAINGARPDVLLAALRSEYAGFYRWLVERRTWRIRCEDATLPSFGKFQSGWLARAYS